MVNLFINFWRIPCIFANFIPISLNFVEFYLSLLIFNSKFTKNKLRIAWYKWTRSSVEINTWNILHKESRDFTLKMLDFHAFKLLWLKCDIMVTIILNERKSRSLR